VGWAVRHGDSPFANLDLRLGERNV
jgi:hypothetical protein